jgi:putative NADH-flavin reductase
MNILIFGASGDVGTRTMNEALSRGHTVTAVIRRKNQLETLPKDVTPILSDVSTDANLTRYMQDVDVVISALRPADGSEQLLVPLTQKILQSAEEAGVRLITVGGAARLKIPGKETTVLSEPGFLPPSVVPIATACQAQSLLFEGNTTADWSYICPPAMLQPGNRTGNYRLGTDTLVTDEQGNSQISMEDFAVAIIDEVEIAQQNQQFFTAAA